MSTDATALVHHELNKIGDRITWLTSELARAEGKRDALLAELQDATCLHDRQPAGVR